MSPGCLSLGKNQSLSLSPKILLYNKAYLGQCHDETVDVCRLSGRFDFFLRHVPVKRPVGDVVGDARIKKHRFLLNDPHLSSKMTYVQIANIEWIKALKRTQAEKRRPFKNLSFINQSLCQVLEGNLHMHPKQQNILEEPDCRLCQFNPFSAKGHLMMWQWMGYQPAHSLWLPG